MVTDKTKKKLTLRKELLHELTGSGTQLRSFPSFGGSFWPSF
jgi:hypothetical protein